MRNNEYPYVLPLIYIQDDFYAAPVDFFITHSLVLFLFFLYCSVSQSTDSKSASKSASSIKKQDRRLESKLIRKDSNDLRGKDPAGEPIPVNTDIPSGEFPMRSPVKAVVVGNAPAIPSPKRIRGRHCHCGMIREDRINTETNWSTEITARIFAGGTLFEMDAMTILPIMIMIQVTDTITVARLVDIKPVLLNK